MRILLKLLVVCAGMVLLSGCVGRDQPYNYDAFRESKPASIVILPPINKTPEVQASYSVMSQLSRPLGEAGYYVFPVALVDDTFKQNGVTTSEDAQELPMAKLHEVFGADAGLYVTVREYGTSYKVVSSDTTVGVSARLVDLRTGKVLWTGSGYASTAENRSNSNPLAMLIEAAVSQVVNSATDYGHDIAATTSERLLDTQRYRGILPGPKSPEYGRKPTEAPLRLMLPMNSPYERYEDL